MQALALSRCLGLIDLYPGMSVLNSIFGSLVLVNLSSFSFIKSSCFFFFSLYIYDVSMYNIIYMNGLLTSWKEEKDAKAKRSATWITFRLMINTVSSHEDDLTIFQTLCRVL